MTLLKAVAKGNLDVVKVLIRRAGVDAAEYVGNLNPLKVAKLWNNWKIARYLRYVRDQPTLEKKQITHKKKGAKSKLS